MSVESGQRHEVLRPLTNSGLPRQAESNKIFDVGENLFELG